MTYEVGVCYDLARRCPVCGHRGRIWEYTGTVQGERGEVHNFKCAHCGTSLPKA